MKESQYVTEIIAELEKIGAKAVKFVETEYSEIGTPDIVGCYERVCFLIEAKVDKNSVSLIQVQRLTEWANTGAITIIARYPDDPPEIVASYIQNVFPPNDHALSYIDWQVHFEGFVIAND